ncbi:MAG: hypothetical protein O3C27_11550 [Actinomycetota bacterium]|nr:hypothetical protein [Actinomycetota bacterium]
MLLDLLYEGLGAALLPCALALLVPGLAVAFAARQESTPAVAGFAAATLAASWVLLSGRTERPSLALVTLIIAASIFALVMPFLRRIDIVSGFGGALAGAAFAALWAPCPGPELSALLADLPTRSISGLALLAAYLIGLLAPLFLLAGVLHLLPSPVLFPVRPFMLMLGATVLGILALLVAVGLHDDLISRLATWSV